jgi:hypothetical protein
VLKDIVFRREAGREQLFSKDFAVDGSCVINATSEENPCFSFFGHFAPRLNEVPECSWKTSILSSISSSLLFRNVYIKRSTEEGAQ